MKHVYSLIAALLLLTLSTSAQINYPGTPLNWPESTVQAETTLAFPVPDLDALRAEDQERDQYKEFAYRFGVEYSTSLDLIAEGTAFEARDGAKDVRVWQHRIACPGAVSMNFVFDTFQLPKGAKLFIWSADRSTYLGAFDHRSNAKGGSFAVGLIYSDDVVIELRAPQNTFTEPEVSLSHVVYGYRTILARWEQVQAEQRGPFGNSGNCNVNVNCPEGDEWQTESRSVALIVSFGSAACTGALVNNTAQDGTPYFLTADHCLGGEQNWVFYFNHESATCSGNTGPTSDSVSGSELKASNGGSDFALLELDEAPPASFNVQYAGWDKSDNPVPNACGIHHPSGDVKKICFEDDDLTPMNWGGAQTWRVADWDLGVTEPGSSGSPLFDQNHRIIGQLYGGSAACAGNSSDDNDQPDYYGRFGVSWDGNSASSRLRDWLDPDGSDPDVLDGWPEGAVVYSNDPASNGFQNVPETLCDPEPFTPIFRLKNQGTENLTSATLLVTYNGSSAGSVNWTGSLNEGQTEDVELPSFAPENGTNSLAVVVSASEDENMANNGATASTELFVGESTIQVAILTDTYGYETYWELRDPNNYVVLSGGNEVVGINGGGEQNAENDDPGAYANETLYEFEYTVTQPGCYTFVIVDDYADGICCAYGDGAYTITDNNGLLLASGGEFDGTSEHVFGMVEDANNIVERDVWNTAVFPNPGNGAYVISSNATVSDVVVRNALGQPVHQLTGTWDGRRALDLSPLPAGTYLIELQSDQRTQYLRVIQH